MNIRCLIGKHQAVPSTLWNDGHFFSKCHHCECDMVSRGGPWIRVPKGYAVRWKPRTERDICWDRQPRPNAEGLKLSDLLIGYPSDGDAGSVTARG